MKQIFTIAAVLLAISTSGWSQANIIQQRAAGLRDANNANQAAINGTPVKAPAAPAAPAANNPPGIPAPASSADQMKLVNQLVGDLSSFKAGVTVTAERQTAMVNDLLALSRVGTKPSKEMLTGLVKNLGTALSEKVLPANEMRSLAASLSGVMNASSFPANRAGALVTRTDSILKGAGISAEATSGVTKSLNEIVNLMQRNKSDLYK